MFKDDVIKHIEMLVEAAEIAAANERFLSYYEINVGATGMYRGQYAIALERAMSDWVTMTQRINDNVRATTKYAYLEPFANMDDRAFNTAIPAYKSMFDSVLSKYKETECIDFDELRDELYAMVELRITSYATEVVDWRQSTLKGINGTLPTMIPRPAEPPWTEATKDICEYYMRLLIGMEMLTAHAGFRQHYTLSNPQNIREAFDYWDTTSTRNDMALDKYCRKSCKDIEVDGLLNLDTGSQKVSWVAYGAVMNRVIRDYSHDVFEQASKEVFENVWSQARHVMTFRRNSMPKE